ncbi:hypothetical protein FQN53_007402, partial [Emmonsiellopsis sp. PD_33]
MDSRAGRRIVEARSLLPLMNLAANPPKYPRNPSKAPLDPVVLYIVRVPGSRDVFLSPLKPPTESSISPELLSAALYYIHVSTPDDENLLQSIQQEKRQQGPLPPVPSSSSSSSSSSSPLAQLNRVQRKPVPGISIQVQTPAAAEPPSPALPPRPVSSGNGLPSSPPVYAPAQAE